MAMATNIAAGSGAGLYGHLRFIEIATGTDDASSLLWPCLEFDDYSSITKDVRSAIISSQQEEMTLVLSAMRKMKQGLVKGKVALLLGKTVPNQNRCVWFKGELVSFIDNFATAVAANEGVAGFKDAMDATETMIEAGVAAESDQAPAVSNDSTTAVGQSDAIVTLDAPQTAVENPPDQGNAVEAKSPAPDTSSSNDEEAIVPQKASLSKDEKVIASKEPSIELEQEAVQTRKTRLSKEEEPIAPKEPSIKPAEDVIALTTKTRASSRKQKRLPARVSLDAALSAEATLQPKQDSPVADASTTSSMKTRRAKHSSGSKRKAPPTVAVTVKKEVAPSTQSKKAKTTLSSEDVIPSFGEVRKSLERGGYVFRDGVYCRPGMDPTQNDEAQVGEGYFKDEQSFRKHLCAYGVGGDRGKWSAEDESLIRKWVRYTVVKSINGEGVIPENEPWTGGRASCFLPKLGFRACTLKGGLQDVIVLPGVSKGEEIVGLNCFKGGQDGIWSHLARSGLPEICYRSGASDRDMLNLELYIRSNAEIETFGKFQGLDNGTSPVISPSQSNVSSGGRSGPKRKAPPTVALAVKKEVALSGGSSGPKRKAPPTVALPVMKEVAPFTQSKKAKTTVSSEDVIPSFGEVRKSLEMGGYVFRDGVYCRPGMDPTKNQKAQVGEGYFEDEQSFRKYLCAYGVDGERNKWTEEDASLIQKWVRYTVVKSINGEGGIPENEPWTGNRASSFLFYKLGFKACTLKGLHDVIVLPGVAKGKEIVGLNCFKGGQDGIWSHLARSGLPEICYRSRASDRDMLNLELYVCCNDKIETFGKFQGLDNGTSPGIAPSQSNASSGGRSTRSLRKRSVDDNASTITADSVGVGTQKTSKKQPNTGKDKKKRGPAKATTASSTKQNTTSAVSTPAFARESESKVGRQLHFATPTGGQDAHLSSEIELETNPLPEIEGTAEEKLSASLAALKMTDQAESNCFYRSGTHFASNLKTILKFLCASIESKGAHGGDQGEPAALYVCGVPGIGKTSGVKWCCTKAIEEATSNSGYEGPTPTVVHINAGHLSSAPKPQGILLEELARALGMKKPKKSYLLKRIKSKEMILVVVDEIDLLVSKSNSQVVEGRLGGTEGVIQTLLDFAEDESMPIALIGISNSSGNDKYHRLNEIGKFKDTVTFKSYSKDDLVGIVQARIGNKIVDPKALEFMAMKVESSTGDARSVLEMTAKAIERRLSAVRDGSRLPSNPNAPLVTMADVMPAVKKSNTKIADTIEGLPTMGKASLCVLATLARVGAKPTTLGKLKRFVTEAMSENQHEELLTLDDFKALVETLVDTGLLTIGGSMKANLGMGNLLTMPISLGLQLEDVQVAITNGLGKERFYENLCEFTKKNTNLL